MQEKYDNENENNQGYKSKAKPSTPLCQFSSIHQR